MSQPSNINIFLLLQVALPVDIKLASGHYKSWYDICVVPKRDVFTVAQQLHDLYTLPKALYVRLVPEVIRIVPAALARPPRPGPASGASSPVVLPPMGLSQAGEISLSVGVAGGSNHVAVDTAEMLSGSVVEAPSRDHTGERRTGSDGDTGGRSEVCRVFDPLFFPVHPQLLPEYCECAFVFCLFTSSCEE